MPELNVGYHKTQCSLIFHRFNFHYAVVLRKLNPYENNRLYGTSALEFQYEALCAISSSFTLTSESCDSILSYFLIVCSTSI